MNKADLDKITNTYKISCIPSFAPEEMKEDFLQGFLSGLTVGQFLVHSGVSPATFSFVDHTRANEWSEVYARYMSHGFPQERGNILLGFRAGLMVQSTYETKGLEASCHLMKFVGAAVCREYGDG